MKTLLISKKSIILGIFLIIMPSLMSANTDEDLRNAQMFMQLIGIQPSQQKSVEKILLKSMKKRVKAFKKLRRVNGRPGEAFEDLKKIQKRERRGLKSILSSAQLSLYDDQIKKNRATFFGKSSKSVPGVQGGQGGGYRNEDKTSD